MNPAIVVLAYDRPEALERLLHSLDQAFLPENTEVPLVISLDHSTSPSACRTVDLARARDWRFGPKTVIERTEHLGVVGHFRAAGELTREYASAIMLEDDLTVAPPFYEYASQVLDTYDSDDSVAGHCLYGLRFNGFTREPFIPIEDGSDVFFLGVPYTQGLCFSARQWRNFEAWLENHQVKPHRDLHPAFLSFGPEEWFPNLATYMAETGRFFSFPKVSLSVAWGDSGAHFAESTSWFQAPIQLGRRDFQFPRLDDAGSVYDGFFELLPGRLDSTSVDVVEFDVDLNATKQPGNLRFDWVLTTRPVRKARMSYGLTMYPPESNVAFRVPGRDISLAHRDDVRWGTWAETEARRRLHEYYWRRNRSSRRRSLRFAVARALEVLRDRWHWG